MAPEHDARMRAFYDHERDDPSPRRRRRAAADWGVNEDIFDRMPSRRFARTDRRAEHHDEPEGRRFERRVSGPAHPRVEVFDAEELRRDDWADEHERRQVAPRGDDWGARGDDRGGRGDDWGRGGLPAGPGAPVAEHDASRVAARRFEPAAERRAAPAETPLAERRRQRRPVESWTEGDEGSVAVEGKRAIQSWLEPDRGESRTIVLELGTAEPEPEVVAEPEGRRTVVITGQPDRLPAPRAERPPRTAVERIGSRPDRIVGYAVALGLLLVLIAVLTTG